MNIKIHDLDLVTALVSAGFNFDEVQMRETRASFHFEESLEIQEAIQAFWSHKLRVSPLEFANIRNNLKSQIYAMK